VLEISECVKREGRKRGLSAGKQRKRDARRPGNVPEVVLSRGDGAKPGQAVGGEKNFRRTAAVSKGGDLGINFA